MITFLFIACLLMLIGIVQMWHEIEEIKENVRVLNRGRIMDDLTSGGAVKKQEATDFYADTNAPLIGNGIGIHTPKNTPNKD